MSELNEKQISEVFEELKTRGLSHHNLREEILDHVCCLIELSVSEGKTFEDALETALSDFSKTAIVRLQSEIKFPFTYQQKMMKKLTVITSVLSTVLIFWAVSTIAQQAPEIIPIENGKVSHKGSYGMKTLNIKGEKTEKFHQGVDIPAPVGTPILATADGVVEETLSEGEGNAYGNRITLSHGETYQTRYAHLSKIIVKKGQKVKKGDVIGYCGNTGASTGPHLHYEVIESGEMVNPEKFF